MSPFIALIFIFLLTLVQLAICIFIILDFYGSIKVKIPYLSVRTHVLQFIDREFNFQPGSVVYDLGAGHGRVLSYLKKRHPAIRAVGVEYAPLPWLIGTISQWFRPKEERVTIQYGDARKVALAPATHIFMYLGHALTNELGEKCAREVKPGTTVITCDFFIENKKPIREIDCSVPTNRLGKKLYVYEY